MEDEMPTTESQIMAYLHKNVFDPILTAPEASERLKKGVRYTIIRMDQLDAAGMVRYYWSAVSGTDNSIAFARDMRAEGFSRFEDPNVLEEFRVRFRPDRL